jgi:glutamine amidotransferase
MQVVIVDYGSGNLRSALKAFERAAREAGVAATITLSADADHVAKADRVVLPGVGAYADCRAGLDAIDGMNAALRHAVENKARPFLGICVGMQLMSTRGLEKTVTDGFDWIPGDVVEIKPSNPALKIPQIGWNTLDLKSPHPLFDGIPTGPDGLHAYFVHSYQLAASNEEDVIADRLRRAGDRGCCARQQGRHPVPPGKEPDAGSGPDRQFPQMEALT